MRVLLLCGYRGLDANEPALGLERAESGKTFLEEQIVALRTMKFDVTCVLSGTMADEQLRHCPKLADVEMVFDDTPGGGSLLSNAREGARSAPFEASFILPVEVAAPPRQVFDFLRGEYSKVGYDTLEMVLQTANDPQGAPWHLGFPLLFTRRGIEQLLKAEDLKNLVDARLKYLHLAPEQKHL